MCLVFCERSLQGRLLQITASFRLPQASSVTKKSRGGFWLSLSKGRILKRLALSPQLFSKATEMITRVLKSRKLVSLSLKPEGKKHP